MVNNNEIIRIEPSILGWARKRVNLSIEDVAYKMNRDTKVVSDWEKGEELPSLAQLEKLAYKVFKVPLAVFFMPSPPLEPPVKKQFRTIPESEIDKLPSSFMFLANEAQYYQEVLKELFNGTNPVNDPIFKMINMDLHSDIIKVSNRVREILHINQKIQSGFTNSTEAFKYYRNQLEKNGVFVFQQTLTNTCRGYSLLDDEFPIIIINSSERSDTGKNFTLFHELSHLLYQTGGITNEFSYASRNQIEVLCNRLASHILITDNDLLENELIKSNRDIVEWGEMILRRLAESHRVSREVILRRLLDLNLTTSKYYEYKRESWTSSIPLKKKSKGGNYYATKSAKLSSSYSSTVLNNLYAGKISSYQASEYLGLKVNQIPNIEKYVFN